MKSSSLVLKAIYQMPLILKPPSQWEVSRSIPGCCNGRSSVGILCSNSLESTTSSGLLTIPTWRRSWLHTSKRDSMQNMLLNNSLNSSCCWWLMLKWTSASNILTSSLIRSRTSCCLLALLWSSIKKRNTPNSFSPSTILPTSSSHH